MKALRKVLDYRKTLNRWQTGEPAQGEAYCVVSPKNLRPLTVYGKKMISRMSNIFRKCVNNP